MTAIAGPCLKKFFFILGGKPIDVNKSPSSLLAPIMSGTSLNSPFCNILYGSSEKKGFEENFESSIGVLYKALYLISVNMPSGLNGLIVAPTS